MAPSRIYTFDEGEGFRLTSGNRLQLQRENTILNSTRLTNSQLALLFVVDTQGNATASELAFALVMDRPVVASNIRALDKASALEMTVRRSGRSEAIRLTSKGKELLFDGLQTWRAANSLRDRDAGGKAAHIDLAAGKDLSK